LREGVVLDIASQVPGQVTVFARDLGTAAAPAPVVDEAAMGILNTYARGSTSVRQPDTDAGGIGPERATRRRPGFPPGGPRGCPIGSSRPRVTDPAVTGPNLCGGRRL
jgi:hypothetical protein